MRDEELAQAIKEDDADACRAAVVRGADVNARPHGWSMMELACGQGNLEICRILLDAGAEIDGTTKLWTPLMTASAQGKVAVCEALLAAGANPLLANLAGETAMSLAIDQCNLEVCQALLQGGVPVNHRNTKNETPLMLASAGDRTEICELLLNAGADMNLVSHNGWNALLFAISKNNVNACRLLFERGADPNAVVHAYGHKPMTAFQMAVALGAKRIVEFFLTERGEDPAQRTPAGRTMMQVATGHPEIKELLTAAKTMAAVRQSIGYESEISSAAEVGRMAGSRVGKPSGLVPSSDERKPVVSSSTEVRSPL